MSYESIYASVGTISTKPELLAQQKATLDPTPTSKPIDLHMVMEMEHSEAKVDHNLPLSKVELPNEVATLINGDPFKLQNALMMQIGTIVSNNCCTTRAHAAGQHCCFDKACHAMMNMRMQADQKTKFINYTAAYAEHSTSNSTSKSTVTSNNLINDWWAAVRGIVGDHTLVPHEWFDAKQDTAHQLTMIAMCAIAMIKIY